MKLFKYFRIQDPGSYCFVYRFSGMDNCQLLLLKYKALQSCTTTHTVICFNFIWKHVSLPINYIIMFKSIFKHLNADILTLYF